MADLVYEWEGDRAFHGDCREVLSALPAGSIDAVITDPPYPHIQREYGTWTEAGWHDLMRAVVAECRRVLKPTGSAVFFLQPNSERVGRMRAWLWEFLAWTAREWNQVQDFWWWNTTSAPTVHCRREHGLARPSLKACVWLGPPDCYRDQGSVLWGESEANAAKRAEARYDNTLERRPSGQSLRVRRCVEAAAERGGVTPFNVLPIPNTDSRSSAGADGHGAGTPEPLCDWWVRYICPPGGGVLDPFFGLGTVGLAARRRGRRFVGIEQHGPYIEPLVARLRGGPLPLFEEVGAGVTQGSFLGP